MIMFREDAGSEAAQSEDAEERATPGAGPFLVCRECRKRIVAESMRIVVDGTHGHVFCNPHGLVFEIGCFSQAPGCVTEGPPVPEFSWFPGYAWRIALCGRCGRLLGWRYENPSGAVFYGLILPHLEPEPDGAGPGGL